MVAIYFIDTSELINLNKRYPRDIFPNLWVSIENLISKGRILAPKEVLVEIQHGDDELVEWCRKHKKMFRDTDALIDTVQKIISEHPTLINPNAEDESADPYIIALAMSYKHGVSGMIPIIITDEKVNSKSHIPHVAHVNGIDACKLMGMFQREDWKF